jgi:DNA invertase Pin-like site-specific DNA recombinase
MAIAYSYIRFSTSEQKKGDSLRRQTELSEQYALEHGLELDSSLHLHDLGVSAFTGLNVERGALGGFLEAIRRGKVERGSYLLVESLDRLSRERVLNALELFISILNHGITIVTLADRMVYSTESVGNNFSNLIISITIMARAHEESVMKSKRGGAAWSFKRDNLSNKKLTARCPAWLVLNASKDSFEFVPERAALVLEILAWHKAGYGQALIAKRLNERCEEPFSKHGRGWHASYVYKIITSPALFGEFQPRLWNGGNPVAASEPISDYFPALITKDEYLLMQNMRSERRVPAAKAKKGSEVPNLFSGVAKCGYCGSTMVLAGGAAQRIRDEGGNFTRRPAKKVLVCDGARRGRGCYAVQWEYKAFEKSFLVTCSTIDLVDLFSIPVPDIEAETSGLDSKRKALRSELDECGAKLNSLLGALELGEPPNALLVRIRDLEAEQGRLTELLHQTEESYALSARRTTTLESNLAEVYYLLNPDDDTSNIDIFTKRVMLAQHIRRLIGEILLYPAGRLMKANEIQLLQKSLLEAGYSEERVAEYIAQTCKTEPQRTGRGMRGRYAKTNVNRCFVIKAKSGNIRAVYPSRDDPTDVQINMGDA